MLIKLFILFVLINSSFAEEIKTLSWNVFMLPKPIKFSHQMIRAKKIPVALENEDYDFMFFQEAFHPTFRREMHQKLKSRYPHNIYLNRKNVVWRPMGAGVFIMSKHPFKVLEHVFYNHCAIDDCLASKGSLLIESKLPSGKTIQFAVTHMQAETQYGAIRMRQLEQLKKMLSKHERAGVPQFLTGDLNIDPLEPEFLAGQELLGMNHTSLEGPLDYTWGLDNECFKMNGVKHEWLDHLWHKTSDYSAVETNLAAKIFEFNHKGMKCNLSDHLAIEGKISLL